MEVETGASDNVVQCLLFQSVWLLMCYNIITHHCINSLAFPEEIEILFQRDLTLKYSYFDIASMVFIVIPNLATFYKYGYGAALTLEYVSLIGLAVVSALYMMYVTPRVSSKELTAMMIRDRPVVFGFLNWLQYLIPIIVASMLSKEEAQNFFRLVPFILFHWLSVFRATVSARQSLLPALMHMIYFPFLREGLFTDALMRDDMTNPAMWSRLAMKTFGFAAAFGAFVVFEQRFRWSFLVHTNSYSHPIFMGKPKPSDKSNSIAVTFSASVVEKLEVNAQDVAKEMIPGLQGLLRQAGEFNFIRMDDTLVLSGVIPLSLATTLISRLTSSATMQSNEDGMMFKDGWMAFVEAEANTLEYYVLKNGRWKDAVHRCNMSVPWRVFLPIFGVVLADAVFM